jgi:hypothetical protein
LQTQLASQLTDSQLAQTELADTQSQFELKEDWGLNDWFPIDKRMLKDQLADSQPSLGELIDSQLLDSQPTQLAAIKD